MAINASQQKEMAESIWQKYEQLSPLHKEIIQKRWMQGSQPIREWLQFIQELANFDKDLNDYISLFPKKKGQSCTVSTFLVGLVIIGFFASLLTFNPAPVIFALILFLLNLGYLKTTRKTKSEDIYKLDLPNYLIDCIYPFLQILQEDVVPDKPVNLMIDMRAPLDKYWKRANTNNNRNEINYQYIFLEVGGVLQDKTRFSLRSFAQVRERQKYHHKGNKYKMRLRIITQANFVFSAQKYTRKATIPSKAGIEVKAIQDKYWVKTKNIKNVYQTRTAMKGNKALEYFKVEEHFTTRFEFSPQLMLENFAQAYQLFEPNKS